MRAAIGDRAEFATQAEQLGTGHAVLQARAWSEGLDSDFARTLGYAVTEALADAYLKINPTPKLSRMRALSPPRLRDAVLAQHALGAAAKGQSAAALKTAMAIPVNKKLIKNPRSEIPNKYHYLGSFC